MPSGTRWAGGVDDDQLVVDASVIVDFVMGGSSAGAVAERIDGRVLHAPAHVDAEVLSAIGRLNRAGRLVAEEATRRLDAALTVPVRRRPLPDLVPGAWRRRDRLRLADALYVELAALTGLALITTDAAFGRASEIAEVVAP
jgi:predicted nucleic acid-binding protein